MTHPDHLRHDGHLPSVQIHREVAGAPANCNQVPCRDHYFALRDNHAIQRPAIDDAGDPVAEIAPQYRIDDESLQAGNVRQSWRLDIEQFHMNSPLQGGIHNASYVRSCTLYFDYSIQIRRCNAVQPLRLRPVTIQSLLNSNLVSKSALASDTRTA